MPDKGRPLKYKKPEDLEKAINAYFEKTIQDEITITGLCLDLKISRQLLLDYQNRDGYKEIVEMAKLRVENAYELSLRKNGRAGDIFALKNMGWVDAKQIDLQDKRKSVDEVFPSEDEILDEDE